MQQASPSLPPGDISEGNRRNQALPVSRTSERYQAEARLFERSNAMLTCPCSPAVLGPAGRPITATGPAVPLRAGPEAPNRTVPET